MTTLTDRPRTALLVVDVQNGVVADAHGRAGLLANLGLLVDAARAAGVDVIWVQDVGGERTPGSDPWQVVPELDPAPDDPRVQKRYGDAFEDTDLSDVLARRQIGRLVVAGAQTDACIRATLHGALVRGYDTVLVGDAHSTVDHTAWGAPSPELVIAHTNLYWRNTSAPGRETAVVSTADVSFTSDDPGSTDR